MRGAARERAIARPAPSHPAADVSFTLQFPTPTAPGGDARVGREPRDGSPTRDWWRRITALAVISALVHLALLGAVQHWGAGTPAGETPDAIPVALVPEPPEPEAAPVEPHRQQPAVPQPAVRPPDIRPPDAQPPKPAAASPSAAPPKGTGAGAAAAAEAAAAGGSAPRLVVGPRPGSQPFLASQTVSPMLRLPPDLSARDPAAAMAAQRDDYLALLQAWLERHKDYPPAAAAQRLAGTVLVSFILDRTGHVLSESIGRSSGSQVLDDAAIETVRRSDPMPPVPASFDGDRLGLTLRVAFGPD